jgi:riboflavin kinase / FMN adenylyltransferase
MPAADFIVARTTEEWVKRLPLSTWRAVVTIGNFDGLHLGHQKILQAVRERADSLQGPSEESSVVPAVLTFYPHPACVLRPEAAPPLLMTLEQRLAAFERARMRATLVVQFDRNLAQLTPEEFVKRYLVDTLRVKAVLVGANFRFGHKQTGDVKLLRELGSRLGIETEAITPVVINGVVVSSTAIRAALREGRVEEARTLLGRPYALAGQIRTGTGLGSKLVVPTLNLATEQELLPKRSVYATEVALDGVVYRAATNVGVRPTFDGSTTSIESHLLDFSEMRTSGSMEVRFFHRLRDEMKFAGPQPLREQILRDIERAREYFQAPKN